MNVSKLNPFPGINPWMQLRWPDAHTSLITYIRDALASALPDDLTISAEEAVSLVGGAGDGKRFYADLGIREAATQQWITPWQQDEAGGVAVMEPLIIEEAHPTSRWIEISDGNGCLLTVIEVLSPVNKAGGGPQYQGKIRHLRSTGVSVVEIDLIRGGNHSVAVEKVELPPSKEEYSIICVSRDASPQRGRHEVYLTPLTHRLPGIRIPLRHGEQDAALDIQPLVDRCYTMGRYWQTNYKLPPAPPLSPELTVWAAEKLQVAGLA